MSTLQARMKCSDKIYYLLLLCYSLFSGKLIEASSYDYSATTECLIEPQGSQYRGGVLVNPEFDDGIMGWDAFGQGVLLEERISKEGNTFMVAYNRSQHSDSLSQTIHLDKNVFYIFSAWVQISEGTESVAVAFQTLSGLRLYGGTVIAKSGCWSMIKGGIFTNFSNPAVLYFESKNPVVEIWVDSVSLQPFTKEEWLSHQTESIEKVRKRSVGFEVTDTDGKLLEGARITINQTKSGYPFGCAINKYILQFPSYQKWFAERFKFTAFTNEMKWYSTERFQGQENYTIPDAMVKFAKQHNVSIRGHNIFWDNIKMNPKWVQDLPSAQLKEAVDRRINSVVSRYKGEVIAWDVNNENLHFSFYEDKLGQNASAVFFAKSHQLDPKAITFMNEYNTLEMSRDGKATPDIYIEKIKQIQAFPGNEKLVIGIGLESHFIAEHLNIPYVKASLDKFGSLGLPIWLTEVDVDQHPNQAQYLEEVLRVGYSHPAVEGIIMFSGPLIAGFKTMPLVDNNFKNTPSGDVVDKLIKEWRTGTIVATTDKGGYFQTSLFHGDYNVVVTYPGTKASATLNLKVTNEDPEEIVKIQIPQA